MNQHRQTSKQEARAELEMLAFEMSLSRNKDLFRERFIIPEIIKYEKKYGSNGFIREYSGRVLEKEK